MEYRGCAGWCDCTVHVLFSDQSLTLFLNGVQVGVTTSVPYLNFVSINFITVSEDFVVC